MSATPQERMWYIYKVKENKQIGPISHADLLDAAIKGELHPTVARVFSAGMQGWAPVDAALLRLGYDIPAGVPQWQSFSKSHLTGQKSQTTSQRHTEEDAQREATTGQPLEPQNAGSTHEPSPPPADVREIPNEEAAAADRLSQVQSEVQRARELMVMPERTVTPHTPRDDGHTSNPQEGWTLSAAEADSLRQKVMEESASRSLQGPVSSGSQWGDSAPREDTVAGFRNEMKASAPAPDDDDPPIHQKLGAVLRDKNGKRVDVQSAIADKAKPLDLSQMPEAQDPVLSILLTFVTAFLWELFVWKPFRERILNNRLGYNEFRADGKFLFMATLVTFGTYYFYTLFKELAAIDALKANSERMYLTGFASGMARFFSLIPGVGGFLVHEELIHGAGIS